MRYVTMGSLDTFDRLTLSIDALATANAGAITDRRTGELITLPRSPSEAWDARDEWPIRPLKHVRIYYEKVHDPNADDYRPRQVAPVEMYESKAGHVLMRAYDYQAGFVKSFRLDQVQRIMISNQNLADDEWGVTDISFRVRD